MGGLGEDTLELLRARGILPRTPGVPPPQTPDPQNAAVLAGTGQPPPNPLQPGGPSVGALANIALAPGAPPGAGLVRAYNAMSPQQRETANAVAGSVLQPTPGLDPVQNMALQQNVRGGHAFAGPPPGGGGPAGPPEQDIRASQPGAAGAARSSWGSGGVIQAHATSLISPESRGQFEQAFGEREAAGQALSNAQQEQSEAQHDALQRRANYAALDEVEAKAAERTRKHALDAQMADYERLQKEASEGKPIYDRRTGGARLMGAVFMGMNALGNAIQRHPEAPNLAKQIIEKGVDDDYREQSDALANKHKAAQQKGELLAKMRERFGDERAAEAGFRAYRAEQMGYQALAAAERAKSPVMKAQADMFKAETDMLKAQWHQQAEHWTPLGVGGSGPDLRKEYQRQREEYDKAALEGKLPQGAQPFPSFDAFVAQHGPGGGTAPAFGVGKASEGPDTSGLTIPQSTNATGVQGIPDPRAYMGATETGGVAREQEAWNSAIKGHFHKAAGARTPEAQEALGKPYLIKKGDTPAVVAAKVHLAQKDLGIGPQRPATSGPPPSSFATPVGSSR
jgi:hypothetical protein